jgi:short-subunit dehydrogenase
MKQFSRRTAVITGAGSGIGRALAIQLAQRNCNLALADLDVDRLKETQAATAATGVHSSIHEINVADRNAMEAFAAEVVAEHAAVHLLLNNAGVTLINGIDEFDDEGFKWVMNTNFWGVVYGTKAFLPHLLATEEAHIVNLSSLFGLMSVPFQAAYCSSKFAVRGFTEALKMELAGTSIGVSCVHPGGIRTGIVKNSRFRSDNLSMTKHELTSRFESVARTTADRAAAKILRGIEKNKRRILIGPDARLADWIVRLYPGAYEKILRLERGYLKSKPLRQS